jgi:septal ring factor EnvC (AmiA/AmiB activator)
VIVLATLLALTLALATYLLVLTRAHEERAAEWEQVARTTGTELAQQRAELDGVLAELEAVRVQLQTAQARITELADEKAQIGDEREAQRQLVDYQARVSDAAGKVARALDVCVDGQYQLISYLENVAAYDAADLARFRTDVQTVCGDARDANAALQLELER